MACTAWKKKNPAAAQAALFAAPLTAEEIKFIRETNIQYK